VVPILHGRLGTSSFVTGEPISNGPHRSTAQRVDGLTERRIDAMREMLAERRRALGMSMSGLAREVGISPSMVSQIERGQTLPSVATLFAIVTALGADVDVFFETSHGEGGRPPQASTPPSATTRSTRPKERQKREDLYVVRKGDRATLDIRGGVRWERLTPRSLETLDFLELVYAPGAESDPELYRHPGIEMVLVLEGAFRIHVGFEEYHLEAGDSIEFASSLPHRYVNPTDRVSRAVTVIMRDRDGAGSEETTPSP
jgi:transcriptional regulator with XRE-family HTH domain